MAKNWTVAEAFEALQSGNKEARQDIGRRFPLFATATPEELLSAIPTHVSARKVESVLRGDMPDTEDAPEEVIEEVDAAPIKPAKLAKPVKAEPVAPASVKKAKTVQAVEEPVAKPKGKKVKPAEDDDFDL